MATTSDSLLERLQTPNDQEAWSRLVHLYAPLLYEWAKQLGVPESDVGDLVQDVFLVLVRKIPEFRYDANKSFRGWLRTVAANKWREWRRKKQLPTTEMNDQPIRDEPFGEREYTRHLATKALSLMRAEFEETTWQACWQAVVESRDGRDIAADLGITVNAVYLAKSRVLRRLRSELQGLID